MCVRRGLGWKKSVALDMSKSIMWNCSLYFHYFYSFGSQIYFHSKAFTLASRKRFWIFLFYSFQHYLNRSEDELLIWTEVKMRFGKVSKSFHVEMKKDFSLFEFSWTKHFSRMNCLCACEKWRYEFELWLKFELLLNGVLLLGGEDWNKILSTN